MGRPGSGKKPRDYPPDIVALACDLYALGLTVKEIRAVFPPGYKVQTILQRYLLDRRPAIKRDQTGAQNHMWRGDDAGYKALHLRVQARRGKPSRCELCGTTNGKFEWSNRTGAYVDLNDYWRLCTGCHRQFDADRRRAARGGGAHV